MTSPLLDLLSSHPDESTALLAPGRGRLCYGTLRSLLKRTAGQLRAVGLGPQDRVALVLPNGPEAATAFLATAAACACAPLNPAFLRSDFEYYLRDLGAQALLLADYDRGPAHEAATALGIPVLRIEKLAAGGDFRLGGSPEAPLGDNGPAASDTALLLHTSGTTSRAKLVPLSGANLAASARHVASTLALTPADRCLNIMPLFHIHGLVAAWLASLSAGASVVFTDGVYATGFYGWIEEFRPTWYTAAPAMHQSILARAPAHAEVIASVPLRFIRSSSASLPVTVLEELERTFRCPVIESYGMTEAAHQMASNPLPPAPRKPGSVGPAAGPRIAILNAAGDLLPVGEIGEVAIAGPNVAAGYDANPEANAQAFTNAWFRTGDQGRLDEDGYLWITGRLKELINRGGEKIAPREIDEVLLAHPAVRQALAFAVPHAQLGEEIAAAVELQAGQRLTATELRAFAAQRLPVFKVPRLIRFVDAIPKGPTAKLQRIGLAARLGIGPLDDRALPSAPPVPPRNAREERIHALWRELLPGREFGLRDRFENLGGDSLLATRMLAALSEAEQADLAFAEFLEHGTIESLAAALDQADASPLISLQPLGDLAPVYAVPGHDGTLVGLARLAQALAPTQPLYAFDLARLPVFDSVEALAAHCLTLLPRHAPVRLAGVCFGGVVAAEIARQLGSNGRPAVFLGLIDCLNPRWQADYGPAACAAAHLRQLRHKSAAHLEAVSGMAPAAALRYLAARAAIFFKNHGETVAARLRMDAVPGAAQRRMMLEYRPRPCPTPALLVRVRGRRAEAPDLGWRPYFPAGLTLEEIPFHPLGGLAEENAPRVAEILRRRLSAA